MEQHVLTDCNYTHVLGLYCYTCNRPSRLHTCYSNKYNVGTM